MRVAVTGGSGRIGSAISKALAERGDEVINLDRRSPHEKIGRFVYCDLRHREIVQPVFEQVDAVVLLGEIPNQQNGAPEEVYSTNTAIGSTVLQTAADVGVKQIIYTSSCQAYGQWDWPVAIPPKLPMDETSPLLPQNPYALSKAANEGYARMIAQRFPALSVTIFRLPWVVFESQHKMWQRFRAGGSTSGEGYGTYVHESDVARAYLAALDQPRPGCEAYHLTGANVFTDMPIRQWIEERCPGFPSLPADWPEYKSPVLLDKAKLHLGWEPSWDLREHME